MNCKISLESYLDLRVQHCIQQGTDRDLSVNMKLHLTKYYIFIGKLNDNFKSSSKSVICFCRDLTIETGKLAKFADGAAVIKVMNSQ